MGRIYNEVKKKYKKNTKYLNKYADELGVDLNTLEDNTKEKEKEEEKEEESGVINRVTTFVKSSIDNLFGTDLLDLNSNDINQSDNKKKLNIDEKYDGMV